jgi:hypothetical protein
LKIYQKDIFEKIGYPLDKLMIQPQTQIEKEKEKDKDFEKLEVDEIL